MAEEQGKLITNEAIDELINKIKESQPMRAMIIISNSSAGTFTATMQKTDGWDLAISKVEIVEFRPNVLQITFTENVFAIVPNISIIGYAFNTNCVPYVSFVWANAIELQLINPVENGWSNDGTANFKVVIGK